MTERYKISFEFNTIGGLDNMKGILGLIEKLGILGASRCIGIVDEKGWKSYLFDGDGADKIRNIVIEKIEK